MSQNLSLEPLSFLTSWTFWVDYQFQDLKHCLHAACMHAKSLQPCPALCNPMDCSPPGSSVHRTLQARILGQVTTPSFKGSSRPRDWPSISYICGICRQFFFLSFLPLGFSCVNFRFMIMFTCIIFIFI